MNVKFGRYIQRVRANKSQLKICEKMERGHIQGLPKFFQYPLLFQERIQLRTSNLAGIFMGPCEQKPLKNSGENGAWAYPGTSQIFWVPPIISGTGKATNFNFCTHILSIDRNKSPLQISGKVGGCVLRSEDSQNFSGHPYIGRIERSSLRLLSCLVNDCYRILRWTKLIRKNCGETLTGHFWPKTLRTQKCSAVRHRDFYATFWFCCGTETARCRCKIRHVSKFIAASLGSPCDSTALVSYRTMNKTAHVTPRRRLVDVSSCQRRCELGKTSLQQS